MILYLLRRPNGGHIMPEHVTITAYRCWEENCLNPDGGIQKNAKFRVYQEYKDGKWGREILPRPYDLARDYISLVSYFDIYSAEEMAIAESERRKALVPARAWDRFQQANHYLQWVRRQRVFVKSLIAEDVKAIREVLPGVDVVSNPSVLIYFPSEIEMILQTADILHDRAYDDGSILFTNGQLPVGDFDSLRQQVESSQAMLRKATAFLKEHAKSLTTIFPKLQGILILPLETGNGI